MATKVVKKVEDNTPRICLGKSSPLLDCTTARFASDFYKFRSDRQNPFNDGYTGYCKICAHKMFEYYLKECKSIQSALYYTCQKLDMPFILEKYNQMNDLAKGTTKKNFDYVAEYLSLMARANGADKSTWTDFSATDINLSDIDNKLESRELRKQEIDEFKLDWGKQDSEEDYIFLEYRYDIYTEGKSLTPAQETLYRQLCLIELSKRRKEECRDSTKEEQEMIIKLMTQLKINNFDEQKDKSEIDRIIEKQIWEIENTEPAEVLDKSEYEDFLDINKNWFKHIVRATKNLVAGTKEYPDITKDNWD